MDPKFVINLSGRDFPLYAGVLSEAHERGLIGIETQLLQVPTEENGHVAIVKATVRMKDGGIFEGIGDASPRNVKGPMATALIRFSETRAKGRALRDAINCGQTLLDELDPEEVREMQAAAPATPHERYRRAEGSREPVADSRKSEPTATGSRLTAALPGFEADFAAGGAKFKRVDLVAGVKTIMETAKGLSLVHEMTEPEKEPNVVLYEFGKQMKQRIAEARGTALKSGQEAAG